MTDQPAPSSFAIEPAIMFGWKKTWQHIGFFLPLMILVGIIEWMTQTDFSFRFSETFQPAHGSLLTSLAGYLVNILVSVGLINVALQIARGQAPRWQDLIAHDRVILRYIGGAIIYGIMVIVGLLIFIFPGIYLTLRYGLFRYFIVDKNSPVLDSFQQSSVITNGVKWNLLAFYIVLGMINVIGALFFMTGLIITVPLTVMAEVHIYRQLTGQQTA
ncbi:hypothetical protein KGQ71_02205 [Patescibacteria group bacterium]|nr:hypothetical protein [Patescibacteria group bacterium]